MNPIDKQIFLLGWAMFLSEGWAEFSGDRRNRKSRRLYAKARAIVLHDRVMTGKIMLIAREGGAK